MSSENLRDDVETWLQKTGFPLEMRVARVLAKHGPDQWAQSQYYLDSSTNQAREIDLMASWVDTSKDTQTHRGVHLAIECKAVAGVWVMFKGGGHPEYEVLSRAMSVFANTPTNLSGDLRDNSFESYLVDSLPRFLDGDFDPCYGISPTASEGKLGKDHAFEATRQALSSAYGVLRRIKRPTTANDFHRCIPLVVTTCRLFTAQLSESNELQVEEVQRESVMVPDVEKGNAATVEVHIVTESALDAFLEEFADMARVLIKPGVVVLRS